MRRRGLRSLWRPPRRGDRGGRRRGPRRPLESEAHARFRKDLSMGMRGGASLLAALIVTVGGASASANVPLVQVSSDPFANTTSQHRTEVEPDTFAVGSTIVSAFQVGRFFDGGGTDIGFATS